MNCSDSRARDAQHSCPRASVDCALKRAHLTGIETENGGRRLILQRARITSLSAWQVSIMPLSLENEAPSTTMRRPCTRRGLHLSEVYIWSNSYHSGTPAVTPRTVPWIAPAWANALLNSQDLYPAISLAELLSLFTSGGDRHVMVLRKISTLGVIAC